MRPGASRGLCAPWRDLACDENRRPGHRARARAGENLSSAGTRFHGRGLALDAAVDPAHRRALVLAAEFLFPLAGADDHGLDRLWPVAIDRTTARRLAVRREHCAVSARLPRARDIELSVSGAAVT